jgi:ketosteroid isomerase-like protein
MPTPTKDDTRLSAAETARRYYERLAAGEGWDALLADDIEFTSFTSPVRQLQGKQAYLEGTKRFYASIRGMQVRSVMADGDRVSAQTHYDLRAPGGAATFGSDVAEFLSIRDGRIQTFAIYFDSAPFPK